jgi:alpha-N-acetylglucosamine transferase
MVSMIIFWMVVVVVIVVYINFTSRQVVVKVRSPAGAAPDGAITTSSSSISSSSISTPAAVPQQAASAATSTSATAVAATATGRKKVAYAITVTKDGPFVDGALVLGYAAKKIHETSSKYDCDLVAFVVPSVVTSRAILAKFGWRIVERKLPVDYSEIENKVYAESMRNSGCCGGDEFLKLWAFTLTEYHRVTHLDMDSILYKVSDEGG